MTPERIEEILRNACRATSDKRTDCPQPYGRIVCKVWKDAASEDADAMAYPDRNLELVARLLEAACLAGEIIE